MELSVLSQRNIRRCPRLADSFASQIHRRSARMQEKEYGGLSHSAQKRLREIAKSIASEKRPQKEIPAGSEKGTPPASLLAWRSA